MIASLALAKCLLSSCFIRESGWLGNLDSHMISMTYKKILEIPSVFPSRATVDATFVPWLWASVNWTGERQ